jgi:hypothetical protein
VSQLNKPGVTVWGTLSSEGVVGPVFFDGTVDWVNYLEMLRDVVVPQLIARANFAELFFQQDGAPLHYALIKKHIKKKYYMVNARFYCAFIYH